MNKILIMYHSKSGHTKKMAEAVAEGVKSQKMKCVLKKVKDLSVDDLLQYDGIIAGSPNYFGSMATEMKEFFDKSVKHFKKLEGKIGGAFVSTGMIGGGGETTVLDILKVMLIHGFIIQGEPSAGHFGPVSIGAPDTRVVEECRKLGTKVAKLVKKHK